jgi:hypothetical protein
MSRARPDKVVGGLGLTDEAAPRKRARRGAAGQEELEDSPTVGTVPVRRSSQRVAAPVTAAAASVQGFTPAAAVAQVAEGVAQPPVAAFEAVPLAVSVASPGADPLPVSSPLAPPVQLLFRTAEYFQLPSPLPPSLAGKPASEREAATEAAKAVEQAAKAAVKAAVKTAKAAVKAASAAAAKAEANALVAPAPLRVQLVRSKHTEGWNEGEMQRLHDAVRDHGRDWSAVAIKVGSRSTLACRLTALCEIAAGRLPQPPLQPVDRPPKHPKDKNAVAAGTSTSGSSTGSSQTGAGEARWQRWKQDELGRLLNAVRDKGRDWLAVAHLVKTRSRQECWAKYRAEVSSGRVTDTTKPKRQKKMWTPEETALLMTAIAIHGRNWKLVALHVASKCQADCRKKAMHEVLAGRLAEPDKKRARALWTDEEVLKLDAAVHKFGHEWGVVACCLPGRSANECRGKVVAEIARGRMADSPAAPPPPPSPPSPPAGQ